jgi:hypothetical protein
MGSGFARVSCHCVMVQCQQVGSLIHFVGAPNLSNDTTL